MIAWRNEEVVYSFAISYTAASVAAAAGTDGETDGLPADGRQLVQ